MHSTRRRRGYKAGGPLVISVGGVAGSGKSYFARMLKRRIPNSKVIEINRVAKQYSLYSRVDRYGTKIVRLRELGKIINDKIKAMRGVVIVVGHLAVELPINADIVVIVRADLREIESRLKRRGYPKGKISENIVSEAVGYSSDKAFSKYKEVFEVMTEKEKRSLISYIANLYNGVSSKRPKLKRVDMLMDMMKFIKDGNRYGL